MAGNDDVGKSKQPRKDIVRDNQARTIFKKDLFFFLVNVEAKMTKPRSQRRGLLVQVRLECNSCRVAFARLRSRNRNFSR